MKGLTFIQGLNLAEEKGLNLILIKENEVPLVKIVDFGRLKYEQNKNRKKNKSNIQEKKQIKLRLNIADNDFRIKINHVIQFLKNDAVVRITLVLNGREIERTDDIYSFFERIKESLKEYGYTQDELKIEERIISLNFKKKK